MSTLTALIDTLEVKNICRQAVILYVAPLQGSPIYKPAGGQAQIQPAASLEAENDRFDAGQLLNMQKNHLIEVNALKRQVQIVTPGGTGSIE